MELNEPKRLFFALWPEPVLQQAFYDTGKTLFNLCGGRRTRRENIHLTLAFLGAVEADRTNRVIAVADQLEAPRFELLFDRLGWWRQNQVAWAASSEVPRALSTLVGSMTVPSKLSEWDRFLRVMNTYCIQYLQNTTFKHLIIAINGD